MLALAPHPSPGHVTVPIIWVNHAMRGLPIRLTCAHWSKVLTPPDAIRLADRLASFAAEQLCGRATGSVDLSEWIRFPISPQRALHLASALLISAECELSETWQ